MSLGLAVSATIERIERLQAGKISTPELDAICLMLSTPGRRRVKTAAGYMTWGWDLIEYASPLLTKVETRHGLGRVAGHPRKLYAAAAESATERAENKHDNLYNEGGVE